MQVNCKKTDLLTVSTKADGKFAEMLTTLA